MLSNAAAGIMDWTVREAIVSDDVPALLSGFCHRLVEAGVSLWRVQMAVPTVHPAFRGLTFTWREGEGVVRDMLLHEAVPSQDFLQSPFYTMIQDRVPVARFRLDDGAALARYPMLERLAAQGGTDYVARVLRFGSGEAAQSFGPGGLQGIAISCTTRSIAGFDDAQLDLFADALPALVLAIYRIALHEVADAVLATYVGPETGRRILAGEIHRGAVAKIEAVLFVADFRDFTALAETYPGEDLVGWLNDHLDAVATPVEAEGGEVLKFIGDGLIAVFRIDPEDPRAACARAVNAAVAALERNAALNTARASPVLALDVAVHAGQALYGNIGSRRRLDFTVIGSAVNTAARMEARCSTLGHHLLLSETVATCCGRPTRPLGPHRLRGVDEPVPLFTILAEGSAGAE